MKRKNKGRRKRVPIRVPKRPELAAPPGAVELPEEGPRPLPIDVFRYGPDGYEEETVTGVGAVADLCTGAPMCWVDVDGIDDPRIVAKLADVFGWHALVLEDVVSMHQRPKTEEYDDYVYVVLLMPTQPEGLPLEQLSLLFGKGYVVTVQAGIPGDPLETVRERIRKGRGRIRGGESDYLAYAIIDAVVDHYFPVVDGLNARLEALEADLGAARGDAAFEDIHAIRNDLHTSRRAVAATSEAVGRLVRGEAGSVSETTRLYLRDCKDHCAQLLDAVEACHELSASLLELYQSAMANRTSEGMRMLTVIATIFIPLSFIAGVYGMNFEGSVSPYNMPELRWRFGYPFALGVMAVVGIGFVVYFRRRGWIGSGTRRPRDPQR